MLQMDKHDRLKLARKQANFSSASAAAEDMAVPVSTYLAHENGNRGFKPDDAAKYAQRFGISASWLLYGRGPMKDDAMKENEMKPDRPDASPAPDGIEDYDIFIEAYREAKVMEMMFLGGRGPREKFAELVHIIYQEKRSEL